MPDPAFFSRASRRWLCVAAPLLVLGACAKQPVDAPPRSVLFFNPSSAALDAPAQKVIADFAADAQAARRRSVVVSGYSAGLSSAEATRTLARLRAQVVTDALVAQGIRPSRIEQQPRAAAEGQPGIEDRRVELRLGS